ncbi:hypothetical protein F4861DRAFT_139597 [Xylaria intraflava]|nr:hypothetical protein F4861DRAFT_139597 [Xylaria intraflava]
MDSNVGSLSLFLCWLTVTLGRALLTANIHHFICIIRIWPTAGYPFGVGGVKCRPCHVNDKLCCAICQYHQRALISLARRGSLSIPRRRPQVLQLLHNGTANALHARTFWKTSLVLLSGNMQEKHDRSTAGLRQVIRA